MRTPTELELSQLINGYDPGRARQSYLQVHKGHRRSEGVTDEQKQELAHSIQVLEGKLHKLENLIYIREHEEAKINRKSQAKKERAAKEREKPKTVAEKAETVRQLQRSKKKERVPKERDRPKTIVEKAEIVREVRMSKELAHGQRRAQSNSKKYSVSELKSLAIKVRGQLAVANQKLAAL